jgi:periplasmic copper chaperone A
MLKLKSSLIALALLVPASAFAHGYTKAGLEIGHPWTRATPNGAANGAAYAKVTNTGTKPDRLIGGTFDGATKVELHETLTEGAISKMRAVTTGIEIKPGEVIEFKPGGMHIMLMGLSAPIAVGPRLKGTLVFETAGPIDVEFKVEPVGAGSSKDEHQH